MPPLRCCGAENSTKRSIDEGRIALRSEQSGRWIAARSGKTNVGKDAPHREGLSSSQSRGETDLCAMKQNYRQVGRLCRQEGVNCERRIASRSGRTVVKWDADASGR